MSDDELFGDDHVEAYRETGGERGFHWRGGTILLLTTTGRKSGTVRTHALLFREDAGRYVLVASKGGAPQHPAWFLNMDAGGPIEIQVKDERFPVTMTVAQDPERERLWKLMCEDWPAYDEYQAKTDREIPVVVLERA